LTFQFKKRGGLEIELVSPSGTKHVIFKARPDSGKNYEQWNTLARGFWDERSKGKWSVRVTKNSEWVNAGKTTINSMSLTLYGTNPSEYPKNPEPTVVTQSPILKATQVTSKKVTITFTPSGQSIVIQNQLELSTDNQKWSTQETSANNEMKVKGLKASSTYFFRGRSNIGGQWTEWSEVLPVTTTN